MHIVSYRGDLQPGGVSTLIQAGLRKNCQAMWWHISDFNLQIRTANLVKQIARIPTKVIQGHYKYANEFLWPLMHDRQDLIRYNQENHADFRALNMAVAINLRSRCISSSQVFTNDYQFALLPTYLNQRPDLQLSHFWHIPWPRACTTSAVAQLTEVAAALLNNALLGFHTEQYAENFCIFVREFLPDAKVRFGRDVEITTPTGCTRLIVNPAGIDSSLWHQLSSKSELPVNAVPYVLSVDRADYSKGVLERIAGIRRFFQTRPEFIGKIQFLFVCERTRIGLSAFDQYWQQCRLEYHALHSELGSSDWSPIKWIDTHVSSAELASLYANARAMLVNPGVDGLNLIAKEFAASAKHPQASLILSSGAGAWHELKDHVITLHSNNPDAIATAVATALMMDPEFCRHNQEQLRRIVRKNSLDKWFERMLIQETSLHDLVISA